MPLTEHNITGTLADAEGSPLTYGTVTFTPYATHDARVDGSTALLGFIVKDIASLPDPLPITEGGWTITIATRTQKADSNGTRDAFRKIVVPLTIDGPLTWGQIVAGAVEDVPITPSLLQQAAQHAADAEAAAASVNPGAPNGTATLDGTGKLPETQVPTRLSAGSLDTEFVKPSEVAGEMATVDNNAASTFRVQQDARQLVAIDGRVRQLYLSGQTLSSVQSWINALSSGSVARLVGSITYSGSLTVPAGVTLDLSAATITQSTATGTTLTLSAGSKVRGGTINCPASWNTTTTGDFTDAVIHIPASSDNCEVDGVTINNVYRLGIGIKADHARIHDCRIEGNLPAGYYTGTETSHYAIKIDPSGTTTDGATVVTDNIIGGCVQGVMVGNFGSGVGRGIVVSGNLFHDCWNHGIYQSHGNGMTFASNTFQRCQKPIVATGQGCTVTGNSMWTNQTGDERDITGIAIRNASDCVVTGNTIIGEGATTAVAINLDNTLGGVSIVRNLIADNTIQLSGSTSNAAIRVGSSTDTTTCNENRVIGNVISAPGQTGSEALIEVSLASGSTGFGNVVTDNSIVVTGPSHGIQFTRQRFGVLANNYIRLAYSHGSATTLIMARLTATTHTRVTGNTWACATTSGTNVTVHGVREMDATCDNNVLGPNVGKWQTTLLAGSTSVVQSNAANASIVGATAGEYAAATTLGSVTGKVGMYDDKGTLLGWAPLYGTIT